MYYARKFLLKHFSLWQNCIDFYTVCLKRQLMICKMFLSVSVVWSNRMKVERFLVFLRLAFTARRFVDLYRHKFNPFCCFFSSLSCVCAFFFKTIFYLFIFFLSFLGGPSHCTDRVQWPHSGPKRVWWRTQKQWCKSKVNSCLYSFISDGRSSL